jgi:hypothetical protein
MITLSKHKLGVFLFFLCASFLALAGITQVATITFKTDSSVNEPVTIYFNNQEQTLDPLGTLGYPKTMVVFKDEGFNRLGYDFEAISNRGSESGRYNLTVFRRSPDITVVVGLKKDLRSKTGESITFTKDGDFFMRKKVIREAAKKIFERIRPTAKK